MPAELSEEDFLKALSLMGDPLAVSAEYLRYKAEQFHMPMHFMLKAIQGFCASGRFDRAYTHLWGLATDTTFMKQFDIYSSHHVI